MPTGQIFRLLAVGAVAFSLAACDSAEERAEKHFESGMSLLADGDVERAIVEFRNVLSLNEFHREARIEYARAVKQRGNFTEAYSQFLRLSEEDPKNMEARIELARMAITAQNWEEAERHSQALQNASGEVPGADAVDAVMRYRQAVLDKDEPARDAIIAEVEALSQQYPEDTNLIRVLIEAYSSRGQMDRTIAQIDRAIAVDGDNVSYYSMKAAALNQKEDFTALEDHLRVMIQRFPDVDGVKSSLVRLLLASGQEERAEEFLRNEIAASETPQDVHVGLVSFLQQTKGADAALAEIEAALPNYENPGVLRALKAGILFDRGDRDAAITEMEDAIAGSEASPRTDQLKIALAKMLEATGNEVGARQLVGEVLESDPSQTNALKMRGKWQIESDSTDEAISTLRDALEQAPQDTETMALLADAHRRAGEFELAQDLLAMAAETSNFGPQESLSFARVLIEGDKLRPAEDVLVNALRQSPGNLAILNLLAEVHLRNEDWARLGDVEDALRREGSAGAVQRANQIRLQTLARTQGQAQATGFLEQLAEDESLGIQPQLTLLSSRIRSGDAEGALSLAEEIVAGMPDNDRADLIVGNTQLALGDYEAAEGTLRAMVDADPAFQQGWVQLLRAQSAQGNAEAARATVDEALEKNPGAPNLLWAKATFLEQSNDIDGAIGIYDEMYQANSNSLIVANNLASLLVTYRDDEESLERAFTIGRRLRGTDVPPFQDTFGWLLYRRGELEEALTYLEPAAEALSTDPIVQFHLASAYQAIGRNKAALERYQRVIEIAGADDPRPQIARAQEEIAKLEASGTTE